MIYKRYGTYDGCFSISSKVQAHELMSCSWINRRKQLWISDLPSKDSLVPWEGAKPAEQRERTGSQASISKSKRVKGVKEKKDRVQTDRGPHCCPRKKETVWLIMRKLTRRPCAWSLELATPHPHPHLMPSRVYSSPTLGRNCSRNFWSSGEWAVDRTFTPW